MSASPLPRTTCPSCGAARPADRADCPACGGPAADHLPPLESVPGPVTRAVAERRWFGIPPAPLLLCLGFGAFGAAVGLFAAGHWPWGLVLLVVAAVLLLGLAELTRTNRLPQADRAALLLADGRSRASTASEIWRVRLDGALERRRANAQLENLARERSMLLSELGRAEWEADDAAAERVRSRLHDVEERRARVEHELATTLAEAEARIRQARLPVDQTMMVAPDEIGNAPYPPPDEADPPQPAQVPEPYPPPDEGTPPAPAPDPPERGE
ncbi:MAG TPA: zinc ribbon domain-containing protein [Gaiellaceae bacterium]|nr:zinc ribbon domain-containing protein [Gaiellaceae bacterium]